MAIQTVSAVLNDRRRLRTFGTNLMMGLLVVLASGSAAVNASEESMDCENADSTIDLNHCASLDRDAARSELKRYLEASYEHNKDDPELIKAITEAQTSWEAYVEEHCDSVYTQWRQGTIRTVMALSCEISLTQQRTHELWETFLTYMDGAPPVLPEPEQ